LNLFFINKTILKGQDLLLRRKSEKRKAKKSVENSLKLRWSLSIITSIYLRTIKVDDNKNDILNQHLFFKTGKGIASHIIYFMLYFQAETILSIIGN